MQTDGESGCSPEKKNSGRKIYRTQDTETCCVDTSLKNSSIIHNANFVAFG